MSYTSIVVGGRTIILDEEGRPCRTCNTLKDFQLLKGASTTVGLTSAAASSSFPKKLAPQDQMRAENPRYYEEPPDKDLLGSHTWTLLHTMAANYPKEATPVQQKEMLALIDSFSKFFPCSWCAMHLREWLQDHKPDVAGREQLSMWFCDTHNGVNERLGKPTFDCRNWKARWRDGWDSA